MWFQSSWHLPQHEVHLIVLDFWWLRLFLADACWLCVIRCFWTMCLWVFCPEPVCYISGFCQFLSSMPLQNYQPDYQPDYQLRADSRSISLINSWSISQIIVRTEVSQLKYRPDSSNRAAVRSSLAAGRDAQSSIWVLYRYAFTYVTYYCAAAAQQGYRIRIRIYTLILHAAAAAAAQQGHRIPYTHWYYTRL